MALGVPSGRLDQPRTQNSKISPTQTGVVATVLLSAAFGVSEMLRIGWDKKENTSSPIPIHTPLSPVTSVEPVAIEQTEEPSEYFLPESHLAKLSDAERDSRIDAFKQAAPADVRTFEDGRELPISGDPIFITVRHADGYRKVRMEYMTGPGNEQALKIENRMFAMKYMKTHGFGARKIFRPTIIKAVKEEDGIANTGEVYIPILGPRSDTQTMQFSDIEKNMSVLSADNVPENTLLCPTIVGPRMFYYVLIDEDTTTEETGELPDEKELAKSTYKTLQLQMADAATIASDDESPHP